MLEDVNMHMHTEDTGKDWCYKMHIHTPLEISDQSVAAIATDKQFLSNFLTQSRVLGRNGLVHTYVLNQVSYACTYVCTHVHSY